MNQAKTQICVHWLKGHCDRTRAECLFAHGKNDLAPCSFWERGGTCSKGDSCERPHSKICPKWEATGKCPESGELPPDIVTKCSEGIHPIICRGHYTVKGCRSFTDPSKKCYFFHPKNKKIEITEKESFGSISFNEVTPSETWIAKTNELENFWTELDFPVVVIIPSMNTYKWVSMNKTLLKSLKPCPPVYINFELPNFSWNGTPQFDSWNSWSQNPGITFVDSRPIFGIN